MRVVNVAVTQGSNKARQAARLGRAAAACDYLGFDLVADRSPAGSRSINVEDAASRIRRIGRRRST